jgi:hypothetical protein
MRSGWALPSPAEAGAIFSTVCELNSANIAPPVKAKLSFSIRGVDILRNLPMI